MRTIFMFPVLTFAFALSACGAGDRVSADPNQSLGDGQAVPANAFAAPNNAAAPGNPGQAPAGECADYCNAVAASGCNAGADCGPDCSAALQEFPACGELLTAVVQCVSGGGLRCDAKGKRQWSSECLPTFRALSDCADWGGGTGGASGTGGKSSTGGASGTGGKSTTGGSASTGGKTSTGGSSGTGATGTGTGTCTTGSCNGCADPCATCECTLGKGSADCTAFCKA